MSKEKLYCYLRVSTKGQVEDGSSIENQRFHGKRVSKKLGMEYVEMNEGGLSSMKDNRPKFEELKRGIREKEIKNIWYLTRSRWTRNTIEDLLMKEKYLIPYKVKVFEKESGEIRDFNDSSSDMLDTILTTVQQFDRKQRREISISGKRHLSITEGKNGVFMGGTINFGYSNIDKKWTENKDESKWVKKIFSLYVQGKSLKEIKELLDLNGVKPRRGNFWSLGSLNVMLRNRVYLGEYSWTDKDTGDVFPIVVPQIISHSLFNRVQKTILKNTKNKGNNSRIYESLLSDFLVCYCGENISGQVRKSVGKNYYSCSSKRNFWKGKDIEICDNRRGMNIDNTDKFVTDEIQKIMKNSSILKERFKKDVMNKRSLEETEIHEKKGKLEININQLDEQIERLTQYRSNNEINHTLGKVDSKLYEQLKKDMNSEFEKLDKQKTQIIGEIDELDNRKEWIDWVGKFGKDISDKFENITGEVLKGVLDSITVSPTFGKNRNGDEIQVGHKLKVKFKLPIINDKLEYIDSSNKSKGYNLVNGKKVKDIGTIGINVGGRGKKKQ